MGHGRKRRQKAGTLSGFLVECIKGDSGTTERMQDGFVTRRLAFFYSPCRGHIILTWLGHLIGCLLEQHLKLNLQKTVVWISFFINRGEKMIDRYRQRRSVLLT